jgi:speckle-type POZ protein
VLTAHRYVFAARSSVFMAELFGPTKAKVTDHICIHAWKVGCSRAMLHFTYTDSMALMDECDKTVMCQQLFLAADRLADL